MEFEWDREKAKRNLRKHKVSFDEAKTKQMKAVNELRPEYNFDYSKAVRGKYYKRILEEGSNVVVLEPDIAKVFVGSAAVNDALRSLLSLTRATQRLTKHFSGRAIAHR